MVSPSMQPRRASASSSSSSSPRLIPAGARGLQKLSVRLIPLFVGAVFIV
jgi:hypothetical protein